MLQSIMNWLTLNEKVVLQMAQNNKKSVKATEAEVLELMEVISEGQAEKEINEVIEAATEIDKAVQADEDTIKLLNAITTADIITPKDLDTFFKFDDGGKTVRRHLRKHFAAELEHVFKSKWAFPKSNPVTTKMVGYFKSKYSVA